MIASLRRVESWLVFGRDWMRTKDEMKYLLDGETLDGPHAARITVRPERTAVPVPTADALERAIKFECQLWGGANTPFVPVSESGTISRPYLSILPGSAIEQVKGMDVHGLYNIVETGVQVSTRDHGAEMDGFGRQLAVALLPYGRQQDYRGLEVVQLADDDPWKGIYAACLGLLPDKPDRHVLRHGQMKEDLRFEDFVNLNRTEATGSLEDLLERMVDDTSMSPRQLSMIHLEYAQNGSYGMQAESGVLPEPHFAQKSAGPNIVVICSPGNVDDLALLWNLRSAHGDYRPLPIGIPLAEMRPDLIQGLTGHKRFSQYGIAAEHVYVTSASISSTELPELLGEQEDQLFHVVDYSDLLKLGGPAGWSRQDVIVWADGKATFVPLPADSKREVLEDVHFARHTSMQVDLKVVSSPFPNGKDIRIDGPNCHFYSGSVSMSVGSRRSEPIEVVWPTRMLIARAVASSRNLEISESEPGRAARVALATLADMWEISNLAHAPLLHLLEEMAARSGFGWLKKQAREWNREVAPAEVVGPTTDQLPEKAFSDFQHALGNSVKAAKYWLLWAERAGLIVKGFQLQCSLCSAKQWIPVAAFSPPIVCRGCTEVMDAPFGESPHINFTYRISERLRRVYEQDAMGHLLTLRFFNAIFSRFTGSDLVGMHPGMNIHHKGDTRTQGEADVLLLFRDAAFIPIEVKRSFSGIVPKEISKLEHLARVLDSPWSAVVACEYGIQAAPQEFVELENRGKGATPFRVILSYDRLLDPTPVWSLGGDPFAWDPLTAEQIHARETAFVNRLAQRFEAGPFDWLEDRMLDRPGTAS
ncbi:hypothetical protein [Arthrobacter sp. MA-N2]|uniref:hypothetical protein n=1 Tax=Arthrobacter sp. MA-N2 TaxID=1101188 RepID=UPI00048A08A3|nr:hypothetical protein [Arthrobacter sp. MA-N2]